MSKPKGFHDDESSFHGQYSRQVFETLSFAYKPFLLRIILMLIAGFVGRVLLLANANFIGVWVDSLCFASSTDKTCRAVPNFFAEFTNVDYLLLLAVITVGGFLATMVFRIGFSRLSARAVSRLYDEVTLRTSRLPMRFFDTNPVGRIVTRFSSDYGNVFRLFGGPLAEFLAIIFDITAMILLVSIASPYYIVIIAFLALANGIVYQLNRERLRAERRILSSSRSPSIAHFAETAQGANTIRIFSKQMTFRKRFSRLNDHFLDQKLRTSAIVMKFSMQMSALTSLLLFVTGAFGFYLAQQGLVSVGSIGVAFTFVLLLGSSMQMFFEWMAQFDEAMTGVERLNDYLRRDLEPGLKLPATREFQTHHPVYEAGEEASGSDVLHALSKFSNDGIHKTGAAEVSIENLWFRYDNHLPFVLQGLDFTIRAGEKIGIVGRTGSGKSTFVQALFHLYPFAKGSIKINGLAARLSEVNGINGEDAGAKSIVDLRLFRQAIAYISQEPALFRGTLRENLDLLRLNGDQQLHACLERVGLRDWFASQSLGLEMCIEERGSNLSAGEKQLICMARCLLLATPIVVMDEATSSVDPLSEEILVRATREFFAERTQIIIAHRLSTIEHCDRILWLHHGKVRMFDQPHKVIPVFKQTQLA